MDDQTKQLLNEALKSLLDGLQGGANFAKTQLPTIVQQKLQYEFWSDATAQVIFTAILGLMCWWTYWACKNADNVRGNISESEMQVLGVVPTAIYAVIWAICSIINAMDMIKITLAPNLYILEWLKSMVSK